jgi:hypothetical protein
VRPGLSVWTGFDGSLPTETVVAQHRVIDAGLHHDRVRIVVTEGVDRVRAGELARSAAPNLGAAVKVGSDSRA